MVELSIPDISSYFIRLHTLYTKLGHTSIEVNKKLDAVFVRITELFNEEADNAEHEIRRVEGAIAEAVAEISRLKTAVGEVEDNHVLNEEAGLLAKLQTLDCERDALKLVYEERLRMVKSLHERIDTFRPYLGSFIKISPPGDSFPTTLEYITKLEHEVDRCNSEMLRRRHRVETLISDILNLWTELGIVAQSSEFDQAVLRGEISPTEENLKRLELKRETLNEEKQERQTVIKNLYDQLQLLWKKLQIDPEHQNAFVEEQQGLSTGVIEAYNQELKTMTRLKKENVAMFIESAREELAELWDTLYYTQEERRRFMPAFCGIFNEESLAAHEREIERLHRMVEELKPLLTRVEKHRKLLGESHEFELASQDQSRLFQKGQRRDPGRLLREEKFRKRMAKELPKIEREVEDALAKYKAQTGTDFLVFGEPWITHVGARALKTAAPPSAVASKKENPEKPLGGKPTKPKSPKSLKTNRRLSIKRSLTTRVHTPGKSLFPPPRTPAIVTPTPLSNTDIKLASHMLGDSRLPPKIGKTVLGERNSVAAVPHPLSSTTKKKAVVGGGVTRNSLLPNGLPKPTFLTNMQARRNFSAPSQSLSSSTSIPEENPYESGIRFLSPPGEVNVAAAGEWGDMATLPLMDRLLSHHSSQQSRRKEVSRVIGSARKQKLMQLPPTPDAEYEEIVEEGEMTGGEEKDERRWSSNTTGSEWHVSLSSGRRRSSASTATSWTSVLSKTGSVTLQNFSQFRVIEGSEWGTEEEWEDDC
ncbi:uncharacterized protein VTP21DRAFT_1833 [Calcarisporiella thermophila]|uniref:uncharacterized protein n=1 Tax=Calcarisporiella thermophila TaxID=911321 RepID=UPI0037427E2E